MGTGESQAARGSPLHQLHQALSVHEEDFPLSLPLQRGCMGVQHAGYLWGEGTGSRVAQRHEAAISPFAYPPTAFSLLVCFGFFFFPK